MQPEYTAGIELGTAETGSSVYLAVRGGFIAKGTSLAAWCREHGVQRQNARACLLGIWSGPKAASLCARLKAAAGLR